MEAFTDYVNYVIEKVKTSEFDKAVEFMEKPWTFLSRSIEDPATILVLHLLILSVLLTISLILFFMLRCRYCKHILKEDFDEEFLTIPRFLGFRPTISDEIVLPYFDRGTIRYLLISSCYLLAFELIYFGRLSVEDYRTTAIVMFILSPIFILIGTIGNIVTLELHQGLLFSFGGIIMGALGSLFIPFSLFCLIMTKIAITTPLMTLILTLSGETKYLTGTGNSSLSSDSDSDDDGYIERVLHRYYEHTSDSVKEYNYVSEDIFGNIQLRGEDGEEIEIYQDGTGRYRRVDNDKLIN